jgi:hypothetical protein
MVFINVQHMSPDHKSMSFFAAMLSIIPTIFAKKRQQIAILKYHYKIVISNENQIENSYFSLEKTERHSNRNLQIKAIIPKTTKK